MSKIILVKRITLILLCAILINDVVAQQISVAPSILRFTLDKGQNDSRVVKITNRSSIRQSMQTSIGDWRRDSLGNHIYMKSGEMGNRSNSAWVTITPSFLEIEPNETAEVLVSIQVPDGDTIPNQMTWSMLFIQGTVEKTNPFVPENQLATQIRESYRFGIHIYNTPNETSTAQATLKDFIETKPSANDSLKYYHLISKNTGDVILKCKSYIEVTNLSTGEIFELPADEFTVFPGEVKRSIFVLPDTASPGEYSLLGILDYGDEYPLEAMEKTISVD